MNLKEEGEKKKKKTTDKINKISIPPARQFCQFLLGPSGTFNLLVLAGTVPR